MLPVVQPGIAAADVAVPLTPREQSLLARGEISTAKHVGGAVVAVMPGLGLGHVVQGRWRQRGWIYTLGELGAFGMIAVAASESDLDTAAVGALAIVGWGSFVGLRVWEVADAISAPSRHNRAVRRLRARSGYAPRLSLAELHIYVARPVQTGHSGAIAGVALRF
jgi:hypothetical protein